MTTPLSTTVHLLRHGEVNNPTGILYGRRPGFHLSDRGRRMAQRVADTIGDRDITYLVSSPLERAQETGRPLAAALGLPIHTDERVIESWNKFEGKRFGIGKTLIRKPLHWPYLWNPWKPSWGEPYKEVVARMVAAVNDARRAAEGHEAVVVSHQLPIWMTRLYVQRKSYVHDPRTRHCTLCSLTSLTFEGERLRRITYSEPAGDMIPVRDRNKAFSSGGDSDQLAGGAAR